MPKRTPIVISDLYKTRLPYINELAKECGVDVHVGSLDLDTFTFRLKCSDPHLGTIIELGSDACGDIDQQIGDYFQALQTAILSREDRLTLEISIKRGRHTRCYLNVPIQGFALQFTNGEESLKWKVLPSGL